MSLKKVIKTKWRLHAMTEAQESQKCSRISNLSIFLKKKTQTNNKNIAP